MCVCMCLRMYYCDFLNSMYKHRLEVSSFLVMGNRQMNVCCKLQCDYCCRQVCDKVFCWVPFGFLPHRGDTLHRSR